jgi:hypothetical protein
VIAPLRTVEVLVAEALAVLDERGRRLEEIRHALDAYRAQRAEKEEE